MAVVVSVTGKWDGSELAKAEAAMRRIRTESEKASLGMSGAMVRAGNQMKAMGDKMSTTGATLTRNVTLPLVGLGALATRASMEFANAMSQLQGVTAATGKQMDSLGSLAEKMGNKTIYSSTEAAEAMVELAKAGMTVSQIQGGALQASLNLAATEGMGLAEAATITTNAMSAFRLKTSDASKIADTFAGAANASTASVQSLAQGMANVGPVAKSAGLNINETAGVLALFDQNALKGAEGGTQLKSLLTKLTPTTTKAKEAMKKLGLDFADAQGRMLPIADIAQQLRDKMSGLTQEQRRAAFQTMFGSYAIQGANILYREGAKGVEAFTKSTEKQGSAQKMANARLGPLGKSLEKLGGVANNAARKFGDALAPTIQKVSKYLQKAMKWFSGLSDETQTALATAAMFAAALGPVLWATGKVTKGLGSVVGAVGRVGVAFKTGGREGNLLARGVVKMGSAAKSGTSMFVQGFRDARVAQSGFSGPMGTLGGKVRSAFTAIGTGAKAAGTAVVGAFRKMGAAMVAAGRAALTAGAAIGRALMMAATAVGRAMMVIGRAMMANPWMLAVAALIVVVVLIVKNWDKIKQYVVVVWNWIKAAAQKVWGAITAYFKFVLGVYKTIFTTAWKVIKGAIVAVWNGIKSAAKTVWGAITAYIRTAIAVWKAIFNGIRTIVGTVVGFFQSIKDGIVEKVAAAVAWLTGLPGRILRAIGNLGKTLWDVGVDLIGGFIEGIKAKAGEIATAIKEYVTDKLPDWVKKPLGITSPSKVMIAIAKWIPEGIAEGIRKNADSAKDAAAEMAKAVTDGIKTGLEKYSDQLAGQIDNVKSKLGELKSAARDVASGVREAFIGAGSLSELFSDAAPSSAKSLVATMQEQVNAQTKFAAQLKKLSKAGLNNRVLDEITGMGATEGGVYAQQLLGSRQSIKQVNRLQAQMARLGSSVGGAYADRRYGTEIDTTSSKLRDLQRTKSAVDRTEVKIEKGAVEIVIPGGVDKGDRKALMDYVDRGLEQAVRDLAKQVRSRKGDR